MSEFLWRVELSPHTRRVIAGSSPREKWDRLYQWLRNHNVRYQKGNPQGEYREWYVVLFRTEDEARRFFRAWEQDAAHPGVQQLEQAPEIVPELSPGEEILARHAKRTARVVEREKRKKENKKAKRNANAEQTKAE